MEQALYSLPNEWRYTELGALCKFENGDRGKNYPSRDAFVEAGIPVINAGNLDGRKIVESGLNYITRERYDILGSGKVRQGDLLFCLRGSLGKCAIVSNLSEGAIASSLVIVRPSESLDPNYLLYYFNSSLCSAFIERYNNGAAQPNLSAKSLSKFLIPLASLKEQKRIVEKLDRLLTRIDNAVEHLQESIILADAFFKSTLSSLVCSESIEHEKLSLEELGSFSGGGTPSKNKSEFWDGEILWITPKDMKSPVITNSELKITQEGVRGSSAKFIPPRSVLIVARSGILRHTLPVCINENECTVNQDIKVFIPNEKISSEYVQYMLKGYESFILSELVKGGVTVESLKYNDFQNFKFPIPSIEEQKRIVEQLSQVGKLTDPIKVELCIKIEYLQQLKASILDSAFKGEL